jgi:hypothetical protein
MSVDGLENKNHAFPRFIEEFSLEADQTKEIAFLFWTAREPPNSNDPILTFGGPPSPAYPQTRKRRPGPSEDERHLRPQLSAGTISRPQDVIVPIIRLIGSLPTVKTRPAPFRGCGTGASRAVCK